MKVTPASGYLSGFILPWVLSESLAADHRLDTDYDEASPEFGRASYTGTGRLTLLTSGTPSSGTTSISARVVNGGMPDGVACGVVARVNGSGDWYGRERPTVATGYQQVTSTSGRQQQAAVLEDGTVVLVYGIDAGSVFGYYSKTRDPVTGTWTNAVTICATVQGVLAGPVCGACIAPDGAVHAYVVASSDAGATFTIDCYRSADGSAWELQRSNVDVSATGYAARWTSSDTVLPTRLRAATLGGVVMMLVGVVGTSTLTNQYWSSDGGIGFSYAGQEGGTAGNARRLQDLAVVAGAFMATITTDAGGSTDSEALAYFSGTPQAKMLAATGVTVSSSTSSGDTACIAWDGITYPVVLLAESLAPRWSTDWGRTWLGDAQGFGVRPPTGAGYCSANAVNVRGQVIVFANPSTGTAPTGGIVELRFGGTSSLTMGAESTGWLYSYTPSQLLNTAGWTDNDTGAPVRTLSAATGENIAAGVGETARNQRDETSTTQGLSGFFRAVVRVNSSISTTPLQLRLRIPGAGIHVELSTTSIRAHDEGGSAGSYVQTGYASGSYVEVFAVVDQAAARAYVWHRELVHTAPGFQKGWTALAPLTALSDPGDDIRFRVVTAASTDADILSLSYQTIAKSSNLSDGVAWSDLQPIPLTAGPNAAWAVGGASLQARGGPAVRDGLDYTIAVTSAYPKAATLPSHSPSPRNPWRASSSWSSDVSLRYTVDSDTGLAAYADSDAVGIYLTGLQGVPVVDVYDGTTLVRSVDLRISFTGQRSGSTVRPSTAGGGTSTVWLAEGEMVGGAIEFASGDVRTIIANTSGVLTSGATVAERRAVITVDGIDGTETTASGTVKIHPPRALLVWYLRGTASVTQLRLDIDSATPTGPNGYRQIGQVCAGPIRFLGRGWDRKTAYGTDTGAVLTDLPTGGRSLTQRRPNTRRAEVAIVDTAVDVTQIRRGGSPDYVVVSSHASAAPAADRWGDPLALEGLFREWAGEPLCWLPSVPVESGSGDVVVAHVTGWARDAIYGRITSSAFRREWAGFGAAQGVGGYAEGFRVATLVVEEEP
jgi:hypothetical protein